MHSPEETLRRLNRALSGSYVVERELGRGGMAAVFLAEDLIHSRKVAIKVLSPEVAHALGSERFLHEIEIAANLNHPNILPLHDSGQAEGLLYYVMPFVEADSLRERLTREKQLPLEEAVRIIREVADALSYAHESHLVHRDIKPENILFSAGHAVVADFGIAKALNVAGGDRLTQTGLSIGTPTYMSPEQAAGTEAVDARSDLYSLACLAYEMLGGEPPFSGPTPQAVLARHAVDPVPKLETIRPGVPPGVARAIEKALAKVPADRFPTPRTFSETIEKASTDEAIAAEVARRERAAGRRRWRVIGATLAVVGLGIWAFFVLISPTYERLAVMPPTNLLNIPGQEHLMQGVHDALIEELQRNGASVKARTAMMRYRDNFTPPRDVADELRVDALIEPSVRWAADSVEIDLRLVDGETEEYIGDPIQRAGQIQDVMSLYRELVRDVVNELQLGLVPDADLRLSDAEPVNPAAYEVYLNGRFHWNRLSQAGMEAALGYFLQALEKEPNYAQAHAGVAQVWAGRQQMGYVSPAEAGPQAREALALALAADSTLFEVQYVAALVRTWVNWDWEGGEESFRRTISLNPDFADVRAYYSNLLMFLDRQEECERQADWAMELDPLKPLVQALQGHVLMFRNRHDEAVSIYLNALQTAPDNPVPRTGLQRVYFKKGMHREALEQAGIYFTTLTGHEITAALLQTYTESGSEEAWRFVAEAWAARTEQPTVNPTIIAELFDRAGDRDRAMLWLERGYEARDPSLPYVNANRFSDALRSDSRFQDLQRTLNLPVSQERAG